MEIIDESKSPAFYRELVRRLKAGQVIMMPTDTIYGLIARADSESATRRIFNMKRRDNARALLVLVSSISMAKKYCRINPKQLAVLRDLWSHNRPTTVILPKRELLPKELTGSEVGLAVRLPKSDFLRKIVKAVGAPLIATSANLSGEPVLDVEGAIAAFKSGDGPDMVIRGKDKQASASRLVRIEESGSVTVLRP